jgi:short subunit dehydrogenase-like uncharacterized protein
VHDVPEEVKARKPAARKVKPKLAAKKAAPRKAAAGKTAAGKTAAGKAAAKASSSRKTAAKKVKPSRPAAKPSSQPAAKTVSVEPVRERERRYDIVLFGATGYTGGLTAEYLAEHAPEGCRWAIAGRNAEKLEAVRERLARINPRCATLDLLVADTERPHTLQKVAAATRVVITTVGPYVLHGEPLVAACADAGTHYLDLTGEPEFVDSMWLRHHKTAVRTGAKLVHCCGFDSIPHDLGAWFTVQQLPEGVPLHVEGFVRAGGQFSAGTYHSALLAFSRARDYAAVARARMRKESPRGRRRVAATRQKMRYVPELGTWVVPFPSIDPQIVKRSARASERYGSKFRYGHYIQIKTLPKAAALVGGVGALFGAAQLPPLRDWLMRRKRSGEGPSPEAREKGWFRVRFLGRAGPERVVVDVTGGDPGYGETSRMLAESALCMAFDDLPAGGGQLTPVMAFGNALIDRLQRIGIRFTVVDPE